MLINLKLLFIIKLWEIYKIIYQRMLLMGRKIKEGKNKYNTFHKLGLITMDNNDFIEKVDKSIEWIKELKKEGINWLPGVTKKRELLPNMNNKKIIHGMKLKELAHKMVN